MNAGQCRRANVVIVPEESGMMSGSCRARNLITVHMPYRAVQRSSGRPHDAQTNAAQAR
jgi:hypothetical protein